MLITQENIKYVFSEIVIFFATLPGIDIHQLIYIYMSNLTYLTLSSWNTFFIFFILTNTQVRLISMVSSENAENLHILASRARLTELESACLPYLSTYLCSKKNKS